MLHNTFIKLEKINLNSDEQLILKKLLRKTHVSCQIINAMTTEELVDGVLFYYENKNVIDKMNKLLFLSRREICSCNFEEEMGVNDLELELASTKEQVVNIMLVNFKKVPKNGVIKIGLRTRKLDSDDVILINLNHKKCK